MLTGSSLAVDDATDRTYGGSILGVGTLAKEGAGKLTLTGNSSAFQGLTNVVGSGRLVIGEAGTGSLGGDVSVAAGASLGGSGTVGSVGKTVTIAASATHAPGNSIGVQTIAGDYINHGTLQIEATPKTADKVIVAGAVDITGATLDLALSPADRAGWASDSTSYTIIEKQSAGAVKGTFGTVKNNLLFLDAKLAYNGGNGNDVTLKLERNSTDFDKVANTSNQISTAKAVEGLASTNPIWRAIATSTDANEVRASLDAVSGEVHASTRSEFVELSHILQDAVISRVSSSFGGAASPSMPVMAYGPDAKPIAVSADHAIGPVFWANGFGSWGRTNGTSNTAANTRSTGGLLIGADTLLDNHGFGAWRLGLMGGYSQSDIKVGDRASSAKSKNIHLGAYAGTQWDNIAFRSALAYTWHDIGTNRHVVLSGLNETLTANYNGGTVQAFGEVAYKVQLDKLLFEPFANLSYVSVRTNGFTESGGVAALTGATRTTDSTFTTIGVRAQHDVALGSVDARLSGLVGWRHAFGNVDPSGSHAFASSSAFAITGAAISRNSAVLEAGIDFKISPAATLSVLYTGQLSGKSQDHGARAGFNVKF